MNKLIALFVIITAVGSAAGQGIQFESETTSWEAILRKAKKEDKLIFVAAYSPTCHNCCHMLENVYPNQTVGAAFNKKYINVKLDVDQGEGIQVSNQYRIIAYPAYLFVNGNGEVLHRTQGTMTAEKMIELGGNSSNPAYQFMPLKARFWAGDRSRELLRRLTFMAKDLEDAPLLDTVHIAYLATQKDWLTKDNMDVILSAQKSIEQITFAFLLKNEKRFSKAYGEAKIKNLIDEVSLNSLSLRAYNPSIRDFDLEKARTYGSAYLPTDLLDQYLSLFRINQFIRKQETEHFLESAIIHFNRYPCYNGLLLNNMALQFHEKTDNKSQLMKALTWSLRAIELKDSYSFNDTAAALYFKLGNKPKAKEYAQKALKKARESGANAMDTIALLKKIDGV